MSTFFLADRIKELSRTENTGPIVLDGASPGFSAFSDFFASGDVVFYAITDNVDYEIGSGIYEPNGSDRVITRFPFRSSKLNSGPYYVNGDEANGPAGYYYPVYLTRSAAQSGVGFADGPYTSVSELTFDEFPGVTFYRPSEHPGYSPSVGISGSNYNSLSTPVDFDPGVKEVFVTYPGKTAVFNGYGLNADTNEPKDSGIAFWRNEQILNYSSKLVWDDTNNRLGISTTPAYAIDVGGLAAGSIVRASGFIEGGEGVAFSGGALTYTGATASGGTQLEPFLRHEKGSGADGVIEFSGVVDQYIGFAKQIPGTVFAGPLSDYCSPGPCPPDYPSFRILTIDDIPLAELTTSGNFIIQRNLGLDSQSANIFPNNFAAGMVALYGGSGQITYDSGIFFDAVNNRLMVGGDASTDTPVYALQAVGTLGSESGYFNQIVFTDDLIRIGSEAGTNDGNLTENYWMISIGEQANKATSGVFDGIAIGRLAGLNSETTSGVILIGTNAGDSATNIVEVVAIGGDALQGANEGVSGVVVGKDAGVSLINSERFVVIGTEAANDASGVDGSVAIGWRAGLNSSGVQQLVAIGQRAGQSATTVLGGVAIGEDALKDAINITDVVAIGATAGSASSGTYGVWIGANAGASVSGDNNIEIVSNGPASSWLGSEASNRLNIQQTIAGNTADGKISIGSPSGTDPLATLTVEPADANDTAFLVRLVGSGSATLPVQIQSGDGTTFYSISNSGNVANAGWTRPSGGLWLPDADPTRNSGVGGHMLWNDNNTLIWNGSPVGGGGSFTSWTTSDGITAQSVTDGQQVMFSGVSGVDVTLQAGRRLIFDAGELSGVLQSQITASDYQYFIVASGAGVGNNDLKLMEKDSVLVVSGVNGIEVDFIDLTDGTNSSGIFELSYNPTAFYSWYASNGEVAKLQIADGGTVFVSGVSGVRVEFEDLTGNNGLFRVAAPELSGVLQGGINDNLGYLSNENGPINVSGVSGVATWASGEFGRLGFGPQGAASGIEFKDNSYIMNPTGIGNLALLNFPAGKIVIRGAADNPNQSSTGGDGSIVIGSGAGGSTLTSDDLTVIGTSAMAGNEQGDRTGSIAIGSQAMRFKPVGDSIHCIAIGTESLSYTAGAFNIGIGYGAGRQGGQNGRQSDSNISIGVRAGADQFGSAQSYDISIGHFAGSHAYSGGSNIALGTYALSGPFSIDINTRNTNTVAIGNFAGYSSKDMSHTVAIGDGAGRQASGIENGIFIGRDAGFAASGSTLYDEQSNPIAIGRYALRAAQDIEQTIAIGDSAGRAASGVEHSVFIGSHAGYKRSGSQSIILSNHPTRPSVYDAEWAPHSQDTVLDIGHAIQGVMSPVNLHIGAEMNSTYRTYSEITSATVNITPSVNNDAGLRLNQYSTDGSSSSQSAGILKTQTKNAGTIRIGLNDIVNKDGYLVLPRATGVTGSSPNKELIADGVFVTKAPGVVALLDQGATKKLCVVAFNTGTGAYEWYQTNNNLSLV